MSEWEKEVLGRRCESKGKRKTVRKVPALVSVFVCQSDKRRAKEFGCHSHHRGGMTEELSVFSCPAEQKVGLRESLKTNEQLFYRTLKDSESSILPLRDCYQLHTAQT